MKKLLIGSVALLLVCGMVGCGKENETVSSLDNTISEILETSSVTENKTDETLTEIDIFEDIEVTVNDDSDDTYGTYEHTYPMEIDIQVKSTNPEIADTCFSVEKTSANLRTIEYTISVDENALKDYLDENNYILKATTKSYVTDVTELSSYLLSTDYLTEENMQILHDDMKDEVLKTIELANEISREAIEQGIESDILDENIELVNAYAILPEEDVNYIEDTANNCSIVYMIFADADKKHYYAWRTVNLRFTFNQTWKIAEATYFYVDNPVSYDNFEDAYAAIEKDYKDFTEIRGFEKIDLVELN